MKDFLAGPAESLLSTRSLDAALTRLRGAELRVTKPRVSILKCLIAANRPIAIDELHEALPTDACDLVTCYRCLSAFETAGIVRRSFTKDGTALLEFIGSDDPNYYVTCRDTNRMARIGNVSSDTLNQAIDRTKTDLAQQGYTRITHSLQFFAESPVDRAAVASDEILTTDQSPLSGSEIRALPLSASAQAS